MKTAAALYFVACLSGTLHGQPYQACRVIQLPVCSEASLTHWLNEAAAVNIVPDVRAAHCGPATPEEDPDEGR